MASNTEIIYQAPLQGFTDFTYRKVYYQVFGGVAKYFIPYLSFGKGREIKKSQLKEILPENNAAIPVVPQVLFSDAAELFELVTVLTDHGFGVINLNLGCPYPMATNRGRGAAWLEKPSSLGEVFQQLFDKNLPVRFSVKMRAGLVNKDDFRTVLEVLNQFPLEEIIFHTRTADQMYDGKADPELFLTALSLTKHPLVYNGDIFSEAGFHDLKNLLPDQQCWMTGRGLLMDPLLPLKLNGQQFDPNVRKQKLKEFHDGILFDYSERLQGGGHLLTKMTQFWGYFSESFENPHKALKLIKKSGTVQKYNAAVAEIFRSY